MVLAKKVRERVKLRPPLFITPLNYAGNLKFDTFYKHIYSFRKYALQCRDTLKFAHVSIIFAKKSALVGKNRTFFQNYDLRTALKIFQFCFLLAFAR